MEITQIIDGIASRGLWFNLAYWSVTIAVFYLGLIVYLRDKSSSTNRAFFIFASSILPWATLTLIYMVPSNIALLANRLTGAWGFFMTSVYLRLCLAFPNRKSALSKLEKIAALVSLVFAIVTASTNLVFRDVEIFYWGASSIPGALYPLFAFWLTAYCTVAIYILIRKLKMSEGRTKLQFQYFLLALLLFVLYVFPISVFYAFFSEQAKYDHFGPFGSLFLIGFTYVAIIRHRLLDVRLVVIKSAVYTTLIVLVSSSYVFFVFYLKKYYEKIINPDLVFIIATFVAAFGFQPLKRILQKYADRLFSKGRYNFEELLKKVSHILSANLVIDNLSEQLLSTLSNDMKIPKRAFVLEDGFQKGNDFYFKKEEVKELFNIAQFNSALVADELEDDDSRKILMRKLGIEVIIYFADEGKAIGFLALSEKASGDAYSSQDLKLLEIIASQITIALKNIEQQQQMIEQIVEERQRINQDAHDHIYNRLGALAKKAEVALESPNDVKPTLELLKDDLRRSVTDLQRIVSGEAEQDSTECLVKEELESIIKDFANKSNANLTFNCDSSVTKKLNPQHFWHLQCILEECLNNVRKHSKATKVSVDIAKNNGSIIMQVKDNGVGINRAKRRDLPASLVVNQRRQAGVRGEGNVDESKNGIGLKGMRERAKKINGEITFTSNNGHGTTVQLKVPC